MVDLLYRKGAVLAKLSLRAPFLEEVLDHFRTPPGPVYFPVVDARCYFKREARLSYDGGKQFCATAATLQKIAGVVIQDYYRILGSPKAKPIQVYGFFPQLGEGGPYIFPDHRTNRWYFDVMSAGFEGFFIRGDGHVLHFERTSPSSFTLGYGNVYRDAVLTRISPPT